MTLKKQLLNQLQQVIEQDLATLTASARTAAIEATHEESRPENKYDTRGLEASYLAGAQNARAAELVTILEHVRNTIPRTFSESDPIAPTAVVELETEGGAVTRLFLVRMGAGYTLTVETKKYVTVTTQSPLGQALLGKLTGDAVTLTTGRETKEYEIVRVS